MRPLGFWLCDVSAADCRRAEKATWCWAEAVLYLGLADCDERRAIKESGEIERQLSFIEQDRKLHPEDYKFRNDTHGKDRFANR
jgi:hypothetical protein